MKWWPLRSNLRIGTYRRIRLSSEKSNIIIARFWFFVKIYQNQPRKIENFLSRDKWVVFRVKRLTSSPLPTPFSQPLSFFVRFQNGRGLFFAPLFFQRILYAFMSASDLPWDLRGNIWCQWYQIILHDLISKISNIATAWTASIINFFDFLIENIQAKWMQLICPASYTRFSTKSTVFLRAIRTRAAHWILSLWLRLNLSWDFGKAS